VVNHRFENFKPASPPREAFLLVLSYLRVLEGYNSAIQVMAEF